MTRPQGDDGERRRIPSSEVAAPGRQERTAPQPPKPKGWVLVVALALVALFVVSLWPRH